MSEKHFENLIRCSFNLPSDEPLWAIAVNLANNVLSNNCEISERGLRMLCCAILQKDKDELNVKQSNT